MVLFKVVRKWLRLKNAAINGITKMSCHGSEPASVVNQKVKIRYLLVREKHKRSVKQPRLNSMTLISTINYKYKPNLSLFVGTWNVGGKSPDSDLDLKDWIQAANPSLDLYVLGFQEIVPLNAANVLGAEDKSSAEKWIGLMHQALNHSFYHSKKKSRYCLVSSKQMVGIFLCIWIKTELLLHVSNLRVSCVGTGIMGYMGNKGSVSISMSIYARSYCFVCTHLASGETERDRIQRNSNVVEILRRTSFPILEHDNIFWLGDLNYRLAAPDYDITPELLKKHGWDSFLERDELSVEMRNGGVFEGWEEGKICFAPTYKYLINSDQYVYQLCNMKIPSTAWCDRVLFRCNGMKQTTYARADLRFSDHRPVYAIFFLDTNTLNTHK